jgi:hypothetical protein
VTAFYLIEFELLFDFFNLFNINFCAFGFLNTRSKCCVLSDLTQSGLEKQLLTFCFFTSAGSMIDLGVAYTLMLVALATTYLMHPFDAFPFNLFQ